MTDKNKTWEWLEKHVREQVYQGSLSKDAPIGEFQTTYSHVASLLNEYLREEIKERVCLNCQNRILGLFPRYTQDGQYCKLSDNKLIKDVNKESCTDFDKQTDKTTFSQARNAMQDYDMSEFWKMAEKYKVDIEKQKETMRRKLEGDRGEDYLLLRRVLTIHGINSPNEHTVFIYNGESYRLVKIINIKGEEQV